jgi:hypothetical protein
VDAAAEEGIWRSVTAQIQASMTRLFHSSWSAEKVAAVR